MLNNYQVYSEPVCSVPGCATWWTTRRSSSCFAWRSGKRSRELFRHPELRRRV